MEKWVNTEGNRKLRDLFAYICRAKKTVALSAENLTLLPLGHTLFNRL